MERREDRGGGAGPEMPWTPQSEEKWTRRLAAILCYLGLVMMVLS